MVVHEEVMLFRDAERDIMVIEGQRVRLALPGPIRVATVDEAAPFLDHAGFGDQAVIVRPAAGDANRDIYKGITDAATLAAALRRAAQRSTDGRALLEPDLRAHHNPTRRDVLFRLGERMARRLNTACPACNCPGYGHTNTEPGLPCAKCGTATDQGATDRYSCPRCPHHSRVPRPERAADPQWCPRCNP